ncbi:hypothetical protein HDU76_003495 [Blyttiomyces sp. JEL0837]|nr:hypothetical protein HDU76_003495 [Blyttiomyces sp. JEL0837]
MSDFKFRRRASRVFADPDEGLKKESSSSSLSSSSMEVDVEYSGSESGNVKSSEWNGDEDKNRPRSSQRPDERMRTALPQNLPQQRRHGAGRTQDSNGNVNGSGIVGQVSSSSSSTYSNTFTDMEVPIAVQETPMIMKNRLMRQEIPPSVASTPLFNKKNSSKSKFFDGQLGDSDKVVPRLSNGGRRRSSLGMRGKRMSASANGISQLPHETIEASEFFRHIDAEQSEPVRLRQLLVWCTKRAQAVRLASGNQDLVSKCVTEVIDDVINGLVNKDINTSWYSRDSESDAKERANLQTKPNPMNEEYLARKADNEADLKRLQEEEELWNQLLKTYGGGSVNQEEEQMHGDLSVEELESCLTEDERLVLAETAGVEEGTGRWAAEMAENFKLDIQESWHNVQMLHAELLASRRKCERLYSCWLKAYDEEHKSRKQMAEPLEILRLLPPA